MNGRERRARRASSPASTGTTQYEIAQALSHLSGEDEACLCAFIDTCEARRQAGVIAGWAITRAPQGWGVGVHLPDGTFVGTDPHSALHDATRELSAHLIERVMQRAPQA